MTSKMQSTSPLGQDGIVRCHHGEQVSRHVSGTALNPGRYVTWRQNPFRLISWLLVIASSTNAVDQRASLGANSFVSNLSPFLPADHDDPPKPDWTDDPIFGTPFSVWVHSCLIRLPAKRPSHTASYSMTPTQASHTLSTPQSTLPKRKCPSPTNPRGNKSSISPDKKRRLEHIEAGLRARHQDLTPSQPLLPTPEQDDVLQFTDGLQREPVASASTFNRTATDVQREAKPPRERYSFLGLSPSQSSEPDAVPSTPKKPPSSTVYGGTSSSALLTPPRSAAKPNRVETFPPTASSSSRPEPVTPTRSKGKERACLGWDALVDAPEVRHSFFLCA